jgi:hypothetical protein
MRRGQRSCRRDSPTRIVQSKRGFIRPITLEMDAAPIIPWRGARSPHTITKWREYTTSQAPVACRLTDTGYRALPAPPRRPADHRGEDADTAVSQPQLPTLRLKRVSSRGCSRSDGACPASHGFSCPGQEDAALAWKRPTLAQRRPPVGISARDRSERIPRAVAGRGSFLAGWGGRALPRRRDGHPRVSGPDRAFHWVSDRSLSHQPRVISAQMAPAHSGTFFLDACSLARQPEVHVNHVRNGAMEP